MTFNDPQVIAEAERFVPVKANVLENRQEAEEFGIRGIPVVVLLGTKKQRVQLTGFTPPDQLLKKMKGVR